MRVIPAERANNEAATGRASYEDGGRPQRPAPPPPPEPRFTVTPDLLASAMGMITTILDRQSQKSAENFALIAAALTRGTPAPVPVVDQPVEAPPKFTPRAASMPERFGPEAWDFEMVRDDDGDLINVRATRIK